MPALKSFTIDFLWDDYTEFVWYTVGSTLNVVVVFQFHGNMLHNPLHCPYIDDHI